MICVLGSSFILWNEYLFQTNRLHSLDCFLLSVRDSFCVKYLIRFHACEVPGAGVLDAFAGYMVICAVLFCCPT